MTANSLTREQYAAIECRGESVALSAGAGCGKTFVLTERFISHLAPTSKKGGKPARLSQLIAITFTDAAAREMRSRIRNACYNRLMQSDDAEAQHHWLRHLREIDAARVSTIHAFCASLLRIHAAEADLDPMFGVLDQSDADVLQYDVIDDVLRQLLEQLDSDALDLAAAYGLQNLKLQISELLGRRHEAAFRSWLDETPERLVEAWRDWHSTHAVPDAVAEIAASPLVSGMIGQLEAADVLQKNAKFHDARGLLLDLLPRVVRLDPTLKISHLQQIREAAKVQGICSAKEWPDGYGQYRDTCKELRDLLDRVMPLPFDDAAAVETAQLGLQLLQLTAKVAEAYDRRKRAQGKLDFDDLLSKAFELVANPKNTELKKRLVADLQLLLVDEFQDTDQLQTDLIKLLCDWGSEAGRLFFVGDFKQSIYRFRGAEPTVFHMLRGEVSDKGRLPLTMNFRSQPEILHFVNALFCDAFSIGNSQYEELRPERKQVTRTPAVEFLWTITPDKRNRGETGAALEARRAEARAIARRIRFVIDESDELPVVDKLTGKPRKLTLGDVAILFRTLGDVQVYEEALREYALDYYLVGGYAFYAQQEIYDVLNLLRAVASAADEVSLAGVLRSPIFSLADETLFWLNDSAGSLNGGLMAEQLPPQLSEDERKKVVAAAATLRHLRSIKDRVPIARLLNEALDRTGYDAVLLAEFLGERKLANLNKLLERARAADQSGAIDLDGFITQLSQFIAREPKESLAATLPEAANVIRLMTVHHAKGLEFPLVIVADLDRPPLLRPPLAALHPQLGPLVHRPADDDNEKTTVGMNLYAALERREELEERKRMLYVACTRAADYLILSSSLEAFDAPKSDWMKLLAERFDLQDGQLIADLPAGYHPPEIRVTTDPQTVFKPLGRSRGPDLLKILEDAHHLAATGDALVPSAVPSVPVDRFARRQFSFSRLTGDLVHTKRQIGSAILPDGGSGVLDPRGFGTLVHDVLGRIKFGDADEVAEWCEHLAPYHVVQNAAAAARSACEMIVRFASSARGGRLASAKMLHREVDFLLAWPLDQENPNGNYVQGAIDCLYEDGTGDWRLLDFKTNDVSAAEVARAAQRYELQLYVYAMAAERALGKPPRELVLHFLRPRTEHLFAWNDTSRQKAIQMLNKAIADSLIHDPNAFTPQRSTLNPQPFR
jgi:ATP-dependent helicase/nuclease subunit A